MTAFNPEDYEQRVVRPLRGRNGPLPDDLLTRYAIQLDVGDSEVAARVREIRSYWTKRAQSTKSTYLRRVYDAFLREDEKLRSEHGDAMLRVSWWRECEAARTSDRGQQLEELITVLREDFGELSLITPGQLQSLRETFGQLPEREVDEALGAAGIRQSTPCDLPRTSGLQDTLYQRLRTLLADVGVSSVPELLHGEITTLRLLTAFESTPRHPAGLTADAVCQAIERENRRSGNRAAREALGILNTAATSGGVDLRSLALFHLLDDVRRHHGNRAPASVLLRQLRTAKLDEQEARWAVASVLAEEPVAAAGGTGGPEIGDLLESGLLRAAQRALADLSDDAADVAGKSVERQSARVEQLRTAARRALEDGAENEALRQLRQAEQLAADDYGISAELRRIPLPAVPEVSAQPDGLEVRVSWRSSVDHEDGTRYRVVRRTDRAPADPDDGDFVGETTATVVRDPEPPAAIPLRYAVFAAVDGGSWSRPAGTEVEIAPPVHDVGITRVRGALEGHWRAHEDAVAVDVRRTDDSGETPVATTGTTHFRDCGANPSAACTYVLRARYRRSDGSEIDSDEVRANRDDRSRQVLQPVTGVQSRRFGDEVVLSWTWPEQVRLAEIGWSGTGGSGCCRTSRQEYRDAGGFRFSPGTGEVRVQVTAVGENASSPTAEVHLPGDPPRVDYTVRRWQRPLVGGGTARVTLVADRPVPECAVLIIAAHGRAIPTRPDAGTVLRRLELELERGEPFEATVALPKLRRPYWLRCFSSTTGIRLVDPPIAQLKAA